MTAFDVGASWNNTLDVAFQARHYDFEVRFSQPYPTAQVESVINAVPGVTGMESWQQTTTAVANADGTDGIRFNLIAVPPQTDMISFPLIEGRWLKPGDTNALVINHQLLYNSEANIHLGDQLPLRLGDQVSQWTVVGVVREIGAPRRGLGSPVTAYVSLDTLAYLTGAEGMTNSVRIQTAQHSSAELQPVSQQLERALDAAGLNRTLVQLSTFRKQVLEDHLVVILVFLLVMALLVVAVGGLALASTMSISVMERVREIGVMRAIGATTRAVLQLVIGEGVVIGLLSWVTAVAVAVPLSIFVGDYAGDIFVRSPLDHVFPPLAMLGWLGLILLISAAASAYPAWGAVRLTVRRKRLASRGGRVRYGMTALKVQMVMIAHPRMTYTQIRVTRQTIYT